MRGLPPSWPSSPKPKNTGLTGLFFLNCGYGFLFVPTDTNFSLTILIFFQLPQLEPYLTVPMFGSAQCVSVSVPGMSYGCVYCGVQVTEIHQFTTKPKQTFSHLTSSSYQTPSLSYCIVFIASLKVVAISGILDAKKYPEERIQRTENW